METSAGTTLPAPLPSVKIYKAILGTNGRVIRSVEITLLEAVAERLAGRDVVVCGDAPRENRTVAQEIENGAGRPNQRHDPHRRAGLYALPHYQQDDQLHRGHCFYETAGRKAARNP